VQQAAKGTIQVADNISEVSDGANATGAASSKVLTAAQQLSGQGRNLRAEVDRFLATVRAA
jgi:methyl-accepting chemotaxis protein